MTTDGSMTGRMTGFYPVISVSASNKHKVDLAMLLIFGGGLFYDRETDKRLDG